ncbi:MAG TPA: hypothetical protein VGP85_05795 [Pyrinomonadaceae bacterium]|jgi:hypothetical protein|nr:hypothetical protein [Pyrinomonadaceae bacterium]
MICPRCNSNQTDDVKFCTVCGANLLAVRQALDVREAGEDFDWSKTWLAEMFMSHAEQKRRRAAIEVASGLTPEVKRYNEIKAGVITTSVGIALAAFLFIFMQGLVLNSNVTSDAAVILTRLWAVGLIPFSVGVALIINGVVVSKKLVEIANRDKDVKSVGEGVGPQALRAANTNEFLSTPFSVTDQTTKHLRVSDQK